MANKYLGEAGLNKVLSLIKEASKSGSVAYKGTWDASTNTPALSNNDTTKSGHYYKCSTAGTQFGITFNIGDFIINNNGTWDKIGNRVYSVCGKSGVVTLGINDISGLSNKLNEVDTIKNTTLPNITERLDALEEDSNGFNIVYIPNNFPATLTQEQGTKIETADIVLCSKSETYDIYFRANGYSINDPTIKFISFAPLDSGIVQSKIPLYRKFTYTKSTRAVSVVSTTTVNSYNSVSSISDLDVGSNISEVVSKINELLSAMREAGIMNT